MRATVLRTLGSCTCSLSWVFIVNFDGRLRKVLTALPWLGLVTTGRRPFVVRIVRCRVTLTRGSSIGGARKIC